MMIRKEKKKKMKEGEGAGGMEDICIGKANNVEYR
jgi:hypothetical protein